MSANPLDRRSTDARAVFFHIFSAKTWFNTGRNIGPEMVPNKI
jgi:hypothetical protein